MIPESQYIIIGNQVHDVLEINDEYLVLSPNLITKTAHGTIYKNKEDAMYANLINNLEKGKDITNYKSSKYYKFYIARLKIEHPEYII